ncbi:hypothetical protein [Faecalibacter macacae]|uniref:Uncharacterized protein n=1 Tax=Faecalibacter macacae TaxID=1859289 RepID=A0A3L9M6G4_9FLAO|nr:hypothetical protein [Faecalibacter macacae]RLZ08615.1 hypothetical protein EAH69_09890 [Faecalibacter macacae]
MLKKLGNFYMKYYATTGIVSSVLATKLIGGGLLFMLILSLMGEHNARNIALSVFLANITITLIAIGINKAFPKVYNKPEKAVIIAMLAPLGVLGFIFGKDDGVAK